MMVNDFVICARDLWFNFRAGQIGRSAADACHSDVSLDFKVVMLMSGRYAV